MTKKYVCNYPADVFDKTPQTKVTDTCKGCAHYFAIPNPSDYIGLCMEIKSLKRAVMDGNAPACIYYEKEGE